MLGSRADSSFSSVLAVIQYKLTTVELNLRISFGFLTLELTLSEGHKFDFGPFDVTNFVLKYSC